MLHAFLTFEFPPDHGGGLATYMQHTLRMLRICGEKAFVLTVDNSVGDIAFSKFEGHDIIRINVVNKLICRTLGYWPSAAHVLADALKEAITRFGRPDIVEVCDGFGLGYFLLQRKLTLEEPYRDLKICVVAHTPCSLIDRWNGQNIYALPHYWTRESELFCLKAADLVLAPSQFIVDELRSDFECADVRFAVVRNPLEFPNPSLEPPLSAAGKPPFYMSGSRLTQWKGVLDLVHAFDQYWLNGGKAALKMFGADGSAPDGSGSMADFIRKRYVQHVEAGRLHIPGLVSPEELARQKQAAIALLHPSHKENFPYTVLEHMRAGGLAMAASSGGLAEVIESGVNGFLFAPKDPGAILATLRACDAMTANERGNMGRRAASRVAEMCDYRQVFATKQAALQTADKPATTFPFLRGEQQLYAPAPRSDVQAPRLSVVVPYFNLPDFVGETVRSALASTFMDLEVVVVDDGSTDVRTPAVLAEIATWPRVRVLRKANGGVAEARNWGVAQARGELITLLDADDLVQPSYYERCIAVLDQYENVGFVGCWNDDFNENGTIRYWPTFNPEPPMQLIFNSTNCQGLMMRRAAYEAGGGHDKALGMFLDDWEATISMLAKNVRGVMLPHPLFRYRIRQGSTFRSKSSQWLVNYNYIVSKHADFYARYATEIICFLNANGSNLGYHNPTFPSVTPAGVLSGANRYSHGQLFQLVRAYYVFTHEYAAGRKLRTILRFFSPALSAVMALLYKVHRRSRR